MAALAYQADILRKQTKKFRTFRCKMLTSTKFGTVTFTLDLMFAPEYLSYMKNNERRDSGPEIPEQVLPEDSVFATTSVSTSESTSTA